MHKKLPKLDLNVTNRCNFRCAHCAFDSGVKNMPEMNLSEIASLLAETKELGGERIDITGGEATLRPDLLSIVKAAKDLDYKVELVTNGSLLEEKGIGVLCDLGLDSIAVSLDGSSASKYQRLRRVADDIYEKVLEVLFHCIDQGLPTKVNAVVTEESMPDMPEIAAQCAALGVSELGIYYYTPVGRLLGDGPKAVDPIHWLDFARRAFRSVICDLKISLEFPVLENERSFDGCGCLLEEDPYHLQILPDGNVYPCAILASYGMPIGNLHEKSVSSIWNDEALWQLYFEKVVSQVFAANGCSCVAFTNFDIQQYFKNGYRFVCPLRKFDLKDICVNLPVQKQHEEVPVCVA